MNGNSIRDESLAINFVGILTIAVWLYQASQWWGGSPWIVSAGFVIASIPTFLLFISCQKIILKGIVIPVID